MRQNLTFWMSATDSIIHPIAHNTIPAMSLDWPNEGLLPPSLGSETAGEFRMVKGSDTVQT